MATNFTTRFTLEERGKSGLMCLEGTMTIRAYPAEKKVMYYPDGSGYPGAPPEFELLDVCVEKISGGDGDDYYEVERSKRFFPKTLVDEYAFGELEGPVAEGDYSEEISELAD